MSILSPLTAVVSAIVPMTWGLLGGDQLSPLGYVALGLALVAVVLVGFVPDATAVRPSARGLAMAVASGAMIGVFMILIDATPSDSGLVPLIMNRAVNAAIMIATIGVIAWWSARRRASRPGAPAREVPVETAGHHLAGGSTLPHGMPEDERVTDAPATGGWRPGLPFAIACGVIDALANALLLVGMRLGDLSVISVLTALYPAGTIILAAIVLRERIAIVQWVGLVLAIGAAGMLALG
jgi:drug/metabolite transporter (DMT)-like permease